MVGHHHREHDVGHGEQHQREQGSVGPAQDHHLAQQTEEEHRRVEPEEYLEGSHHEDGAVDTRQGHQPLVDEAGYEHEDGQQRVAVYVVLPAAPL